MTQPVKPVRVWCVVGRKGHLFPWTAASTRRDAIAAFVEDWHGGTWNQLRDHYSCVRCRLVPEDADG